MSAEHPELFDVNYIHGEEDQVSQLMATKDGRDKLRSLGYVGSDSGVTRRRQESDPPKEGCGRNDDVEQGRRETRMPPQDQRHKDAAKESPKSTARDKEADWMHVNAVAYNADLDQIVMSSPHFSRNLDHRP